MTGSTWWRFGSLLILVVLAACEPDDASLTGPESEAPQTHDAIVAHRDGLPDVMKLSPNGVSIASSALKAPSGGDGTVVYSSLGDPTWPVSLGYQATATTQSGDYVALTQPGVVRTVEVGMSSWACESGGWHTGDCTTSQGATFTHPITLNLYAVDYSGATPAPGELLASVEQEFELPYRPSADPGQCSDAPEKFYDDRFEACVNGYNTSIIFDLSSLDVVVPAELMFGVEYNTQTWGNDPIGSPGPYNSLNVALQNDTEVTAGSSVNDDDLLWEADGVPFDLYQFAEGSFPYATAAAFTVSNEGFVTGGGWFTAPAGSHSPNGDGVVNANPDDGWLFNAEEPFVTPAGFTDEEADVGSGSLGVDPITNASGNAAKFILRYIPDAEILIAELDAFSIDFLIDDAGSGFDANQFYINVYALTPDPDDGSWYDCRFDYVASSGSTTDWTSLGLTGSTVPTAVGDQLGGTCPATLDGMPAGSTLLFISVNLGDTSANDTGVGGYFDDALLIVDGSTRSWDFEPPSAAGRASFGFTAKYKKGANVPSGNTQFNFQTGGLDFHSTSYDWLVVNQGDSNAQFKGEGTINGTGSYDFMIWAGDDDPDTFRIKIWEEIAGVETVVFDNGSDQPIEGGQIVIHTGKGKK